MNIDSGVFSPNGSGSLTGTLDINSSGVLNPGVTDSDGYSVASNGRATLTSGSSVIWIVSPTKAYALSISQGQPGSANPTVLVIQR